MIPIIIPYYKNAEALESCKLSIEQQAYSPVEVYVRDNSDDNILYTRAINEGLRKYSQMTGIKYILILNQDAFLQKETINKLVNCMENNEKCGICCPIQVNPNGGEVFWSGSYDAFPVGRHSTQRLGSLTADFDTYWGNGAAMLLRVEMIREIGLLDENMQFICSDADYSFTARARGWRVTVTHDAFVNHVGSSSAESKNNYINTIKARDALYFSNKWLSGDLYRQLSFEGSRVSNAQIRANTVALNKIINSRG
jgi:GT2 family glycosyltransferase